MDAAYILNRDKSFINRYKLKRRALEIIETLLELAPQQGFFLLDIGSADGALLGCIKSRLQIKKGIGLEPSYECLKMDSYNRGFLINGIGERLPFKDSCFDVLVAASVMDHLSDAGLFLKESHRVLKRGGLIAITAIVHFYDRIANITGVDKGLHPHTRTFTTQQIADTLVSCGFDVVVKKRFAMPTFGLLPFERRVESLLRAVGFERPMFYSLVAGRPNK